MKLAEKSVANIGTVVLWYKISLHSKALVNILLGLLNPPARTMRVSTNFLARFFTRTKPE